MPYSENPAAIQYRGLYRAVMAAEPNFPCFMFNMMSGESQSKNDNIEDMFKRRTLSMQSLMCEMKTQINVFKLRAMNDVFEASLEDSRLNRKIKNSFDTKRTTFNEAASKAVIETVEDAIEKRFVKIGGRELELLEAQILELEGLKALLHVDPDIFAKSNAVFENPAIVHTYAEASAPEAHI